MRTVKKRQQRRRRTMGVAENVAENGVGASAVTGLLTVVA